MAITDILFPQAEPLDVEDYLGTSTPTEVAIKAAPQIFSPQQNYRQFFRPQPVVDRNLFTPIMEKFTTAKQGLGSLKDKGIDLGKMALSGIMSAVTSIPGIGVLVNALPKRDYRQTALEDFYGNIENGTIQSGLMAGYNPVSGGLLNILTGGRYGDPTNYGLQRSYQKRINMIRKNLGINKYKDPDTMRKRLEQLEELKRKEAMALEQRTIDRARQANPDVYRNAASIPGALGPGGGFSTTGREGAFSSKSGRGRQDY